MSRTVEGYAPIVAETILDNTTYMVNNQPYLSQREELAPHPDFINVKVS